MTIEFSDPERRALVDHLRRSIASDPYPLAPRLRPLRAVLAKLDPPARAEPFPAPKPAGEPSLVLAKKRRARR
jgi:hypothetical protein